MTSKFMENSLLHKSRISGQLIMYNAPSDGSSNLDYSPTLLVLFAEFIKLIISISMYAKDNEICTLIPLLVKERKSFLL